MLATSILLLALSAPTTPLATPTPTPTVDPKVETLSIMFGLYQSDKATVMYRQFTPVIEHIQTSMEQTLGRPVDIELKIHKSYQEANDALVNGEVDFVRFGPASYILAKERNPNIELIAMESRKGGKRFEGIIVVGKNSPYKTVEDLRGVRFAFGDENSTIGRYLVQAELVKAGLTSSDFAKYEYLDRHDKVLSAVALGDFDAGSVKDSTFSKSKDDRVRALARFDNVTKPWIARAGLPTDVRLAIRDSLLAITDSDLMSALKVDGFLLATDDDYQFVREGMKIAERFERTSHDQ